MQNKPTTLKCEVYPFNSISPKHNPRKIFKKSCQKIWWNKKMVVTLHSQTGNNNNPKMLKYSNGAVVQLVRIHACHAWGRGFESRPHR